MSKTVKLFNAALDMGPDSNSVVIRGVVTPDTLAHLQIPSYQREVLPTKGKENLLVAARNAVRFPDIELALRGTEYRETDRGVVELSSDVYILDGLQRISALRIAMDEGITPHIGAVVHIETDEAWERKRFRTLNAARIRVGPGVLIRNMRTENQMIQLLWEMCDDPKFVLHRRVAWGQNMKRGELITVFGMLKVIGALHGHLGPGAHSDADRLAAGLEVIMNRTGKNVFRDNIRNFYEMIDQMWGIQVVAYAQGAHYLRTTFLVALARVLSRHTDFWRNAKGSRLLVEADLKAKIKGFAIRDPQVINLSGSAGKAVDMLQVLIVDHINSGRRTRRLTRRGGDALADETNLPSDEENGD